MSEFKGTPGKWKMRDLFDNYLIIDKNQNLIKISDNKHNALLISKAPEMLEMLRNISDNEYVSGQTYNEIEELIKQATEI